MVGYYIYGRDSVEKYHSYINTYSQEDEKSVFIHMIGYHNLKGVAADQRPEKIYYFNFSSSKGRAALIGKTTYNTGAESPMADEQGRSSVFVHQYLFDGDDRNALMQNQDQIFCVRPFCTRVEDILEEQRYGIQRKRFECTFDAGCQEVFETRRQRWKLPELLDYFRLDEKKLEELLYTFIHCEGKVYIMLPENTREATERAQGLMRRLFAVLPAFLVETAGFLTYAYTYANYLDTERYIPVNVRFVFLANTQDNLCDVGKCKSELRSFLFCPECSSGVVIRRELYPVVQAMKRELLTGEHDKTCDLFWSLLDANVDAERIPDITEHEKICMYRFTENLDVLIYRGEKRLACPEEEFIHCLEGLLEHPEHWRKNLTGNSITSTVNCYLSTGHMTDDFYPMLFHLYDSIEEIRKYIEDYLTEQIRDLASLRRYSYLLSEAPALKEAVFGLIYQKESCYRAALEVKFEEISEMAEDRNESAAARADILWDLVEYLGTKNEKLIQIPEAVEYVRRFLCSASQGCKAAEEKELLEHSQERIRMLPLDLNVYEAMLQELSEEYLSSLGAVSNLKKEELSLLREWPRELVNRDLLETLDQDIETTEIVREFQSVVKTRDIQKILKYLERQNSETIQVVSRAENTSEAVGKILMITRRLDEMKAKRAEKEDLFDKVHERLLLCFRNEAEQILDSIMRAPLGGVAGMASIDRRMRKYCDDEGYLEYLEQCMHDIIQRHFEEYGMERHDKKAIKQEKEFLSGIGIQSDMLSGR